MTEVRPLGNAALLIAEWMNEQSRLRVQDFQKIIGLAANQDFAGVIAAALDGSSRAMTEVEVGIYFTTGSLNKAQDRIIDNSLAQKRADMEARSAS